MIYLTLFLEFFKIGLFFFGGAFGMIPLIEETVRNHGWLTESGFYDLIGVCESTPGPIAVNMATYIGATQGGLWGSLVATLGVVLPSFFIILLIASVMRNLTQSKYFKGFMRGVKPVVVGLILSTGSLLFIKAIGYAGLREFRVDVVSVIIFVLLAGIYFGMLYIKKKKMSSVKLILLAAGLGVGVSLVLERIVM